MTLIPLRNFVAVAATLIVAPLSALAQQASLTLKNSNAVLAHYSVASWSLTKNGSFTASGANPGIGDVNWTVAATRGADGMAMLGAFGFVEVQNTGSASATIGNIVVNLQRSSGQGGKTTNWVTAASDIANATRGDAATSANISSGASSEGRASFAETAASGALEFADASSNTVFALAPQKVLAAGETARLMFSARFNNALLNIAAGSSIRLEVIVTFGNAGGRGNSGASSSNVDINGDGVLSADEANVRSVPTRLTLTVPALIKVQEQALLVDEAIVASGTVTLGQLPPAIVQSISASTAPALSVGARGGASGGIVTNTANLSASDVTIPVQIDTLTTIDPVTQLPVSTPVYAQMLVAPALALTASAPVPVPAEETIVVPPPPTTGGTFASYTQGGWGATPHGNNPASILAGSFGAVYPGGLTVGRGFALRFTSSAAVGAFLPAGGPPQALTGHLTNPTSSSAGVFGGQVVALRLNVDFSAAGVTAGTGGAFGALKLAGTGTPFDGQSIASFLVAAETVLGGGALPAGMTLSAVNALATSLNESYDNGVRSAWAAEHLAP